VSNGNQDVTELHFEILNSLFDILRFEHPDAGSMVSYLLDAGKLVYRFGIFAALLVFAVVFFL